MSLAHVQTIEPEGKNNSQTQVAERLFAAFPAMLMYWHHFHSSGRKIATGASSIASRADPQYSSIDLDPQPGDTTARYILRQMHFKEVRIPFAFLCFWLL